MTDRGYGRISLDTMASGSIAKQHARIKAAATEDFVWYPDESVSGSKVPFNERPAGARLLADLQPGDRVLVTKIDRAARSVRDLLNLVEKIEAAKASIVFVDQNIDTSGPMGRFLLTLLGAIAELEAAIIAERRRESLEQFAQEGRHAVGRAPFGFESVPNPKGRGLVIRPHPEQAPILKQAIERVLNGETQESVGADLGMSKSGFRSLLTNPRLAGMTPDGDGVVVIDGIPRVDPEAAILSMTEWTRLQATFNTAKTWAKHDGIGAALSCCVCGDRLYYQASKRKPEYSTYKCRGVRPEHKDGLGTASVIARNGEAQTEKVFLAEFGDRQGMVTYYEGTDEERAEAVALATFRLQEAKRRLDAAQTDEEEDALFGAYRQAKKALRDAEAIPETRRMVTRPTGMTVAEQWEAADNEKRVLMLKAVGDWVVQTGRLPIEEKVRLRRREVDFSPAIPALTPIGSLD